MKVFQKVFYQNIVPSRSEIRWQLCYAHGHKTREMEVVDYELEAPTHKFAIRF